MFYYNGATNGGKHKYKENKSYCFQWEKNTPNIKQVTAKRMLGVIIDEKLTFKDHIKHICTQAGKSYSQQHSLTFHSLL